MNLFDQAASDLQNILSDPAGFSVPIKVTDPAGASATIRGKPSSVGATIDPDTGVAVAGTKVTVALPIRSLQEAGLGQPRGVSDHKSKPWRVEFTTPTGQPQIYKVSTVMPDELGCLICILESWSP